jgi:hypothetical protein
MTRQRVNQQLPIPGIVVPIGGEQQQQQVVLLFVVAVHLEYSVSSSFFLI